MMSGQRFWFRWFGFALSVVAAAALTSCASNSQTTASDDSAATDESGQAALGAKINACAIQRARLEGAKYERKKFRQLLNAVEVLLRSDTAAVSERRRLRDAYKWASDFRATSLQDIRLTLDGGGVRIDGSAASFADVAEFLYRTSTLLPGELSLAEASRSSDQQVNFRIVEAYRLTTPFGGVTFDEKLFPPREGRSLEQYAADLCDFGDDSPPKATEALSQIEFERLSATRDGWLHPTLRARVPHTQIRTILLEVEDYDGVTVHHEGDEAVVDLFRTKPSVDFDGRGWLEALTRAKGVSHDHALHSPPDYDKLITWREEGEFPAGVSRAMLGNMSWYRYQHIHRLYRQIAEDHARTSLANTLGERNVRGLRASLCLMRAYSAPADDLPESQTRPIQTGKLTFSVPNDGIVAGLSVDRIRLDSEGATEWEFSSSDIDTLTEVKQALATCLDAADLPAPRPNEDQTASLSGSATAPSAGLFEPMGRADDLPRFEDGLAFVLGIRDGDRSELKAKLYAIRNQQQSSKMSQRLSKLAPAKADVDSLTRNLIELTRIYQVDLETVGHHAVSASDWTHIRPFLVELEAEASPAGLLAFITQTLDLERVLVPAELTITTAEDGARLQVHAKFYAFFND